MSVNSDVKTGGLNASVNWSSRANIDASVEATPKLDKNRLLQRDKNE